MQGLSFDTPSPISDSVAFQKMHDKEDELVVPEELEIASRSDGAAAAVSTFKYRSRASMVRSSRGHEMMKMPPGGETDRLLAAETEGHCSSNPRIELCPSKDNIPSSSLLSSSGEECMIRPVGGDGESQNEGACDTVSPTCKIPPTKTHPYSRRIEITPRTASPSSKQSEPQQLLNRKTEQDLSPATPPVRKNLANLERRRTISSFPSNRRLLPATPVRRNVPSQTVAGGASPTVSSLAGGSNRNSICEAADSGMEADSLGGDDAVDGIVKSADSKLVNRIQDSRKSPLDASGVKKRPVSCIVESSMNPAPTGAAASMESKEDHLSPAKVKHTVQYNQTSNSGKWFAYTRVLI